MVRRERVEILIVACRNRVETPSLGSTKAETPVGLLASVCANTQTWGGCSPDILGGTLCVSGVAETPATWVIPGGDSAPTKMTTHLGDSRTEAEHHRNLWGGTLFLLWGGNSGPSQGGVSGPPHSSTMGQAAGVERNLTGSSGRNFCSTCPGRRLRP